MHADRQITKLKWSEAGSLYQNKKLKKIIKVNFLQIFKVSKLCSLIKLLSTAKSASNEVDITKRYHLV